MELKIINTKNTETGKITLPEQFKEEIRPDLIKRAVLAIQSHKRQAYGADPEAGQKASAELSRRRRKYRGSYGFGISRIPRKILSRRGTRMGWVGAIIPGTVGGRRAHPPKSEKNWAEKINVNERRKAIRSAISATLDKNVVEARGHVLPENYPFIIDDDFESLNKTKDVRESLQKLGLEKDLERGGKKTIRAGKGKHRARRYKKRKSLLLVVSSRCSLSESAKNMPGVEVTEVKNLNAELLAPGTDIGRLTLFTKKAIAEIENKRLFITRTRLPKPKTQEEKKTKKTEQPKTTKKTKKTEQPKTTKKTEKTKKPSDKDKKNKK